MIACLKAVTHVAAFFNWMSVATQMIWHHGAHAIQALSFMSRAGRFYKDQGVVFRINIKVTQRLTPCRIDRRSSRVPRACGFSASVLDEQSLAGYLPPSRHN
jgi:hypothetical protein